MIKSPINPRKARRFAKRLLSRPQAGPHEGAGRFTPPPPPELSSADEESNDVWGFKDTRFAVSPNGSVVLEGTRYDLSGSELPNLLPWIRDVMQLPIPVEEQHPYNYPPKIPAPKRNAKFMNAVKKLLSEEAWSQDGVVRLRHGHGHTQEEMYQIKYGSLPRVPDVVVYPSSEDHVQALVAAAREHDVCLIPYGGGTSVTEALRCHDN